MTEDQEDETFPRELPSVKGLVRLRKNHSSGFSSGFMKGRPELVKEIPLMVISAMAGALAVIIRDKGKTGKKLGLSLVMGDALSNLYDRVMRGYMANYFTIEWKSLKKVVFSLGDMLVFLGSTVSMLVQAMKGLEEVDVKKEKK